MENRYSRQIPYIGKNAQDRLAKASVCIIGCGALGSVSAELLARAGIGKIKLVDRDFVDISNLQRQRFDESDVDKPKALALANKLKKINSSVSVVHRIGDFNPSNAEATIKGFDLVVDGLDNQYSRFVLNDACVKSGIPFVYGSAIKNTGFASFVDVKRNCLGCFIKNIPAETETCETAGVTNTITSLIASVQAGESLGFLAGKGPPLSGKLFNADLDKMSFKQFNIKKDGACKSCSLEEFDFIHDRATASTSMCGSRSFHLSPPVKIKLDLNGAAKRLPKGFSIKAKNEFLVRAQSKNGEITVFGDGRMITGNIDKKESEGIFRKVVLF